MNPAVQALGANLRLQVAVQLLAAMYPKLTDAEQNFTAARMKAALAHADELIALEAASRPMPVEPRADDAFVSDGYEG